MGLGMLFLGWTKPFAVATCSTGQTSTRQVVLAAVQQNGSVGPRDREIFVAPCKVCYRDVHGNLVFRN